MTVSRLRHQQTSSRTRCAKQKKHDKREPGLFKEEGKFSERLCLCSEIYYSYDAGSKHLNFNSKGLNRMLLESGDDPLQKLGKTLDDALIIKSTNRSFRTNDQTKRRLTYFNPEEIFEDDGIHEHTHWSCKFNFLSTIFCVVFAALLRSNYFFIVSLGFFSMWRR